MRIRARPVDAGPENKLKSTPMIVPLRRDQWGAVARAKACHVRDVRVLLENRVHCDVFDDDTLAPLKKRLPEPDSLPRLS